MKPKAEERLAWAPIKREPRRARRGSAARPRAGAAASRPASAANDLRERQELFKAVRRLLARNLPLLRRRANAAAKGNFVRAAVGLRTTGKKHLELADELVVKVYVARKISLSTVRKKNALIPAVLRGRRRVGRKFIPFAVATDVEQDRRAEGGQHATAMGPELLVHPTAGAGCLPLGTTCCLLRDTDEGSLFLLSCKHVLGVPIQAVNAAASKPLKIKAGASGGAIGVEGHGGEFGTVELQDPQIDTTGWTAGGGRASLDAAIARVLVPSRVSSRIGGHVAKRIVSTPEDLALLLPNTQAMLVTRRGALPVRIDEGIEFGVPLPGFICPTNVPGSCGSQTSRILLFFRRIVGYRAPAGSIPPAEGDSGSALLVNVNSSARTGDLVGMHFWGDGAKGYAELLVDVVRRVVFGRALELVSDHGV